MPEENNLLAGFTVCFKRCSLLFIGCLIELFALAQDSDTVVKVSPSDTSWQRRFEMAQKIGTDEARRSIQTFKEGRLSIQQGALLEEIKKVNQQLKLFLKHGIDTLDIAKELESTRSSLAIVEEGVFTNKGSSQTQRNLSVSAAVTQELLGHLSNVKKDLDAYASGLVHFKDKIDSLSSDTALYKFPPDSLNLVKYIHKFQVIAAEIKPVDSASKKALVNVQELQIKVDLMVNQIRFALEDIELYRKDLAARNADREFANIWGPVGFSRPFNEVIRFSFAKERLAFIFYIKDHLGRVLILVILLLGCYIFLNSLKRESINEKILDQKFKGQLVMRYPFLSAVVIVLGIFQFLFPQPPFIFTFSLWLISAICLSVMLHQYANHYWMRFWFLMLALFLLAGLDNFVLQASRNERWFMLVVSLGGIIYACKILFSGHGRDLREKSILYFISFVALFQTLSFFFNLFGRYNLSKAFFVSGYTGVMIAVLLLWAARLINEGLSLASQVYKHPDKKLFYINFDKVGDKVPTIFYILLIVGWVILVGRNFYVFKLVSEPLTEFLTTERTLGEYSFSVQGMFVFLFILFCSLFLSRVISFFTSDINSGQAGDSNKAKRVSLGSWMLLVRIFVISVGVFLAFAAAGIPLDRITIILGALGVGIGLGLQGLVSNLVSGLIIAFEKPVNVGDVIELNGKLATMKSIGFRSSIVIMSDGACIIIPNVDLLSQHLVNWSMARQVKKISVVVGVAYGTDLEKVKNLLADILKNSDRILKHPGAGIQAKEFNRGAIDFELSFWVSQAQNWGAVKSEVISNIDAVFAKEGIRIPIPQEDVYIHSMSSEPLPPASQKE